MNTPNPAHPVAPTLAPHAAPVPSHVPSAVPAPPPPPYGGGAHSISSYPTAAPVPAAAPGANRVLLIVGVAVVAVLVLTGGAFAALHFRSSSDTVNLEAASSTRSAAPTTTAKAGGATSTTKKAGSGDIDQPGTDTDAADAGVNPDDLQAAGANVTPPSADQGASSAGGAPGSNGGGSPSASNGGGGGGGGGNAPSSNNGGGATKAPTAPVAPAPQSPTNTKPPAPVPTPPPSTPQPTPAPKKTGPAPTIMNFYTLRPANCPTVNSEDFVSFYWRTTDANNISIHASDGFSYDNLPGLATQNFRVKCSDPSHTFTITASGPGGSVTKTITVAINRAP